MKKKNLNSPPPPAVQEIDRLTRLLGEARAVIEQANAVIHKAHCTSDCHGRECDATRKYLEVKQR